MPFTDTVTGTTNTAVQWQVNASWGHGHDRHNQRFGPVHGASAGAEPCKGHSHVVSLADATKSAPAAVTIAARTPTKRRKTFRSSWHDGRECQRFEHAAEPYLVLRRDSRSLVQRNGLFYILSNNHVLARSDSATLGDNIVQQGWSTAVAIRAVPRSWPICPSLQDSKRRARMSTQPLH